MGDGQWAMGNEAMRRGPRAEVGGQMTEGDGRWAMGDGQ